MSVSIITEDADKFAWILLTLFNVSVEAATSCRVMEEAVLVSLDSYLSNAKNSLAYKNIVRNNLSSDVNECSTNNGGCEHGCVNNVGSFQCTCRSGFRLSSNRKSCTGNKPLCLHTVYLLLYMHALLKIYTFFCRYQ